MSAKNSIFFAFRRPKTRNSESKYLGRLLKLFFVWLLKWLSRQTNSMCYTWFVNPTLTFSHAIFNYILAKKVPALRGTPLLIENF